MTGAPEGSSYRRGIALVGYAALLVVLAFGETPRPAGDGDEYLGMATTLADGRFPRALMFGHFWMYSALAAPGVRIASWIGANPLWAFTALNILLLLIAFRIASRRLHWSALVLLFVAPILWWSDKAATETFTFALVSIVFALLPDRPGPAMVVAGLASTQNPPFAALVPLIAVISFVQFRDHSTRRRLWLALAAAAVLSALHPLYYYVRVRQWTGVGGNIAAHVPTLRELLTILIDPNVGLGVAFPTLIIAVAAAGVTLVVRDRRALRSSPLVIAAVMFAALVVVTSQIANVNHGGTPGMSRYVTWFIPLAIPLFVALDRAWPRSRRWMVPLALISAGFCAALYRPSVPERSMAPTRLARWLWTHAPGVDNPLPEIFQERLSGNEDNWLPVSTAGCEKVLTTGRGPAIGVWPVWCALPVVPAQCREVNQLCYANRNGDGYRFVIWRSRAPQISKLRRQLVWTPAAENIVHSLAPLPELMALEPAPTSVDTALVRHSSGISEIFTLRSPTRALVYVGPVPDGGSISLNLPSGMSGTRLDAETGQPLQQVDASATLEIAATSRPSILWLAVRRLGSVTHNMVMKQVTLAQAKATLSALLDRVEQGETVAILRRHRVVAELRPSGARRRAVKRPMGLAAGEFVVPDDFDAPLASDVLKDFEGA